MNAPLVPTPLTDTAFRTLTDALLSSLETTIDDWLQNDVVDIDAIRNGGVLDLTFPNGTHVIVNTQPPLHEIWLAALSGGYHYQFCDGQWQNSRDGGEFLADLSRAVSEQAGLALRFVSL
jgi:CyaY protein